MDADDQRPSIAEQFIEMDLDELGVVPDTVLVELVARDDATLSDLARSRAAVLRTRAARARRERQPCRGRVR